MKKAAGYIRVSTLAQVEKGESLTTQKEQIQSFAKQRGWELTNIYADEWISGTKASRRPQFRQMLDDAKANKFEVIVFTKLSRFARNAREYLNFSYDLEEQGILLASIKENIDPTTKTGKMIAGILALFAEWERDTIREQLHENKMARWRKNETFVGNVPFGYVWNKDLHQLDINQKEAAVYKRLVSMYVDQGLAFHDIAIRFNNEGQKCKRAKWTNSSISYMLKNPCYYGNYVLNRHEFETPVDKKTSTRTGKMKDASEHITFKIPPLISKSRWDLIQEKTQFNKVKAKRSDSVTRTFFLRDVLTCARCGGSIKPRQGSKRKDGSRLRYYVCFWAGTSKKTLESCQHNKCSLNFITAEKLEKAVWSDVLMKFSMNPGTAYKELFDREKHSTRIAGLETTIQTLEADLKKKQKARKKLYLILEDEDMDLEEIKQRLFTNKEKIMTLESNLAEVRASLEESLALAEQESQVRDFFIDNKDGLKQLRKDIANLDPEDKKILIEGMLESKIKVDYQDDTEIDGPGGPDPIYKLKWNPAILQRLADEGKITLLNKNGYGQPAGI
jgi:site-specific DNA recombinase